MTRKIFPYQHLRKIVLDSPYRVKTVAESLLGVSQDALQAWMTNKRPPSGGTDILLRVLLRLETKRPGTFIRELEAVAEEDGIALEPKTRRQIAMQKVAIEAHEKRRAASLKPIPKARIADLINQARARQ